MSKYSEAMGEAVLNLRKNLRDIMSQAVNGEINQRTAMRIILTTFVQVGKEKNLPIMTQAVVSFIVEEYPHLKEDLDKILILL